MPKHLTTLATFALLALLAAPAAAEHDGEIGFETLEVSSTDSGQLRINYEIDGGDWNRLNRGDVNPGLNIFTKRGRRGPLEYAYNFGLASQGGSFTLPSELHASSVAEVQLAVVGFAEDWRVRRISVGRTSGPRLAFAKSRGEFSVESVSARECRAATANADFSKYTDNGSSGGSGRSSNWKAKVIEACDDAVVSDEKDKCTQFAMKHEPGAAADVVGKCEDIFFDSSDVNTCLQITANYSSADTPEYIEACDNASTDNDERKRCLGKGKDLEPEWAVDAVRACEEALGYSEAIDCVDHVGEYSADPVPMIEACESAAFDLSDQLACIDHASELDEGGEKVIEACEGDSLTSCIDRAAQ